MSRSKHTIPPRIRASRRVRAPFAPRGEGEPGIRNRTARELKLVGIVPLPDVARPPGGAPTLPRVIVKRPRPGHLHPAGKAEVARLLRWLGPRCTYGLRTVELVQGGVAPADRALPLGRLLVPGRIQLFDQPVSPWVLFRPLSPRQEARLRQAGARVERVGMHTVVAWPGRTLTDFMLFDALAHEIAHHLIQQYTGKRPARVARTRDHEAFAERFAARCRHLRQTVAPTACRLL